MIPLFREVFDTMFAILATSDVRQVRECTPAKIRVSAMILRRRLEGYRLPTIAQTANGTRRWQRLERGKKQSSGVGQTRQCEHLCLHLMYTNHPTTESDIMIPIYSVLSSDEYMWRDVY